MVKPIIEVVTEHSDVPPIKHQFRSTYGAYLYLCSVQDVWLRRVEWHERFRVQEIKQREPPANPDELAAYHISMLREIIDYEPRIGPQITITSLVTGDRLCDQAEPPKTPVGQVWNMPEWPWWNWRRWI